MNLRTFALILGLAGLTAGASQLVEGSSSEVQKSYYSNGHAKESVAFVDDLRHGLCRRWHRDGSPRAEGEFDHGQMVGQWTFWSEDGQLDLERSGYYVAGRKRSD
jgi:antitoxin component YwqK of YwqJK toxin-antitoxin module